MPEVAAEVAQFLQDGDDDDALRFLLDGVLRLRELHSPEDLSRFRRPVWLAEDVLAEMRRRRENR